MPNTDEHHDNRYEDGEPLPETDWGFEPYEPPAAVTLRFAQWAQHGAVRQGLIVAPDERGPVYAAFVKGWNDSIEGRSDFKRRLYPTTSERLAYMAARFLAATERRRAA